MTNLKVFTFILLFCLANILVHAQVTLQVAINSGSSTSTCTDGAFGGPPELQWEVQIAGQGYTTYPMQGACYANPPNTQYSEIFQCPSVYPTLLQVCFRAFEDDGSACVASRSCLVTRCFNYPTPAIGTSSTYTLSIPNVVANASSGSVNFTITASGSYPPGLGNDLICNSINLGTVNSGATIGNNALSNYGNFCASNAGDPNPWGGNNDQGVWFRFTTGPSPGSEVTINAVSDPQSFGDGIDLQLAVYTTTSGFCSGALSLNQEDYQGLGLVQNESLTINCPPANTNYFVLVDGENTAIINPNGQEGYFGIEVTDNGIQQVPDFICDAENLGAVPNGGSVAVPMLSRSNACATNLFEPVPSSWSNNNGVWFQFQAPPSGSVLINANSDPMGNQIDIELVVYETSTNLCSGIPSEVGIAYNAGLFDESLSIDCLSPGQNYWLMLDGSVLNTTGTFDVTITDPGAGCALPVEFLIFEGRKDREGHLLEWRTASENNNDYFTIESSIDSEKFTFLASVKGQGNTTNETSYTFYNNQIVANEINYYRLSQTDVNGEKEYLKMIAIEPSLSIDELVITPNPVLNTMTLTYSVKNDQQVSIQIMNALGNVESSFKWTLKKGRNSISTDLSFLNRGVYMIQLLGEDVNQTKKIVKL